MIELNCFECGARLEFVDQVMRRDECESCGADVRVCKNCQFYDPKSYNECRETQAEVVKEKDRSNFCDFFQAGSDKGGDTKKDELMSAAEALFSKK